MTFQKFYPFYLQEHSNPICALLHIMGAWGAILCGLLGVALNSWWFLGMPLAAYGAGWVGHTFFQGNKPTTLTHSARLSFLSFWKMWWEVTTGKINIWSRPASDL